MFLWCLLCAQKSHVRSVQMIVWKASVSSSPNIWVSNLSLSCLDVELSTNDSLDLPSASIPHTLSIYCICSCYDNTLLSNSFLSTWPVLHEPSLCDPQSSEHFQAGHASPAHPVPRGPRVHEEAVWAVFSPERAQPSPAQQGPLQSGPSALRRQVQCGRRVHIWIWTPAGPQQHVGFSFGCLRFTLHVAILLLELKKVNMTTIMVLSVHKKQKNKHIKLKSVFRILSETHPFNQHFT